jgi:tetratricopeptide (TPR) repeat protein
MKAAKSDDIAPGAGGDASRQKAVLQAAITEAFTYLNAGAPQAAIAHIRQYSELAERSDVGAYVFGLIFFNADDPRSALAWFDRALALQPANIDVLNARAIVLQRLGQPQDALQMFEAIHRLQPDNVNALFSIGVTMQSLGRMNDALEAYERVLHLAPDHCEASTNRGVLLERFGRYAEALACFTTVEATCPHDSGNLFNKGSVLEKLGRLEEALAAYEEAARCGPPDAEIELNRGNALQKLNRLDEAIACYDRASLYGQGYPQALFNKGIALQALGRRELALAAYDAALALDPSYCEALCNRANILHERGHHDEALAAYDRALKLRPGFVPALTNRANVLLQLGEAEEAVRLCDDILRHERSNARAYGLRGAALHKLGQYGEALDSLDEALQLDPAAADAWLNRGNVLQDLDRHTEAIVSYREALRVKPNYPEALSGLGVALKETGAIDDALACFNEALRHKPDYPDARNNRAGVLLLKGALPAGFEDYESRWDRSNAPPRTFVSGLPVWYGQDPKGLALLVWDEQGLGDLIQFSRYLVHLADLGADVTLLCRKPMQRLLRTLPRSINLVDSVAPDQTFDFQIALLSLPRAFRTSLETIPDAVPYLRAEPDLVAKWAKRIGVDGFRIGICWHGNAAINLKRSIPLTAFAPLAAIKGVRLISLTKDPGPISAETENGSFTVQSLGSEFDSGPDAFIDCAAVMMSLDLIVTSDTAIAHLAGALGRAVFLGLKQIPDWRWLLDRKDCPWYPTMRLFRQPRKDDWASVLGAMAAFVELRVAAPPEVEWGAGERMMVKIPVAVGDLIDRITILEIKESRIAEPDKLDNIRRELSLLRRVRAEANLEGPRLKEIEAELKAANAHLWNVEDSLRHHETCRDFDADFISLAREVYSSNDRRAGLKRQINLLFNSAIIEEKSYPAAGEGAAG